MEKVWKVVLFAGVVILAGMLLGGWVFCGFIVTSKSMTPNIEEGSLVFVNRLALRNGNPGRGSVVLLRVPGEETQVVLRVLGLPGETVEYRAGEFFVNGAKIEERYLPSKVTEDQDQVISPQGFGPAEVPYNSFFVMGDNRRTGRDSRAFGFVKKENLIGKAWMLWGILSL